MKTCHDHFEENGNPWLTERERKNLQASLLPAAGGRRYARPRLPYTDPIQDGRGLLPDEIRRRAARKNTDKIAQLMGVKPRQLAPVGPQALKGIVTHIPAPQRVELGLDRADIVAEAKRQDRQWKAFLKQERASKKR